MAIIIPYGISLVINLSIVSNENAISIPNCNSSNGTYYSYSGKQLTTTGTPTAATTRESQHHQTHNPQKQEVLVTTMHNILLPNYDNFVTTT